MSSPDIKSIAFALDPSNVPSFLLDWELTKKCNLDCSYCPTGIEGGHDNTLPHPPLDECLATIDFMYKYVDLYMQHIKPSQRKVVLNVYGGESIAYPDIVTVLEQCREKYREYSDKWVLTITCTTNGVISAKMWEKIVPFVDEFSVSYHAENSPKQHNQYINNILYLQQQQKRFKCVIMMHNDPEMFTQSEKIIKFCQEHNMRYVAKPLDNLNEKWAYSTEQYQVLKNYWVDQTAKRCQSEFKDQISKVGNDTTVSISQGRPCCGGRKLSINSDLKSSLSFVPKQGFEGWYCSVNWFFLFVQQVTGNIYTNKDCRMSTSGQVEPLGNLKNASSVLDNLKYNLDGNMPVVQCKKPTCLCGFCAPKAESKEEFLSLIKRTAIDVKFVD